MSLLIIIILWSILDLHLMRVYYLRNKKAIKYVLSCCDDENDNTLETVEKSKLLEILEGKTSEN